MRDNKEIRKAKELKVIDNAMMKIMGINVSTGEIMINGWTGSVIWSPDEGPWEHVSVSPYNPNILPSWEDLCKIKRIFWGDEEGVLQVIPKNSTYVNMKENCMHLWRPKDPEVLEKLEL
jgi:hypothetical protein